MIHDTILKCPCREILPTDIELNNIFQFFDYAEIFLELRIVTGQNHGHFFFQQGLLIFGALGVIQKKIGNLLIESKCIIFVTALGWKQGMFYSFPNNITERKRS